jgi:hypothetical protein
VTTSGSFTFDPSVSSLMDEAFERAGVDPQTLTHRHIISAKMSLNLMFTEWAVEDTDALYRDAAGSTTISAGDDDFPLPAGGIDILDLVMAYNGETTDNPLSRISRQDYLNLANKAQTGRPSLYYVDVSVLNTPTVVVWPVPEATCIFTYDYMRTLQTVTGLSETTDVQRLWLEALASGWAAKLAGKYNVARVPMLTPLADRSYRLAKRAGSGNSRVVISGRGFGSSRTRRR